MKTISQQLNITEFPFEIKDNNGNRIYYEYSDEVWVKKEYDSNGKQIYFENSGGFWSKSEYNSNGKEIYYETSKGTIEDNRPNPCDGKLVEVDGIKYKLTKA